MFYFHLEPEEAIAFMKNFKEKVCVCMYIVIYFCEEDNQTEPAVCWKGTLNISNNQSRALEDYIELLLMLQWSLIH